MISARCSKEATFSKMIAFVLIFLKRKKVALCGVECRSHSSPLVNLSQHIFEDLMRFLRIIEVNDCLFCTHVRTSLYNASIGTVTIASLGTWTPFLNSHRSLPNSEQILTLPLKTIRRETRSKK